MVPSVPPELKNGVRLVKWPLQSGEGELREEEGNPGGLREGGVFPLSSVSSPSPGHGVHPESCLHL